MVSTARNEYFYFFFVSEKFEKLEDGVDYTTTDVSLPSGETSYTYFSVFTLDLPCHCCAAVCHLQCQNCIARCVLRTITTFLR